MPKENEMRGLKWEPFGNGVGAHVGNDSMGNVRGKVVHPSENRETYIAWIYRGNFPNYRNARLAERPKTFLEAMQLVEKYWERGMDESMVEPHHRV